MGSGPSKEEQERLRDMEERKKRQVITFLEFLLVLIFHFRKKNVVYKMKKMKKK